MNYSARYPKNKPVEKKEEVSPKNELLAKLNKSKTTLLASLAKAKTEAAKAKIELKLKEIDAEIEKTKH